MPKWIFQKTSGDQEGVSAINTLEGGAYNNLKSVNLRYIKLGRWADGTNESSTKRLMFQVLFLFHNFLQSSLQKLFKIIFIFFNNKNKKF